MRLAALIAATAVIHIAVMGAVDDLATPANRLVSQNIAMRAESPIVGATKSPG